MSTAAPTVAASLARVPFLADVDPASVSRLAGLTNINHLVTAGHEHFVLRIPGAGTSEYINRQQEEVAARAAAAAGVNAEVMFFDASDGLMVTRFVDGAVTMTPERFTDLGAVARAGHALRRLHHNSAAFTNDFMLFEMIDEYRVLLAAKDAELPDGYTDTHHQATRTRAALQAAARPLVPSHCDPLCENFLDTGTEMVIIDYEYAGNNDAMWDLGDLSVEGSFGPQQDEALRTAYFGGPAPEHEVARMVAYQAMCDLLWTLWGVLQHVNDNPAEDFWAYATARFERCRTLMAAPEYAEYLHCLQVT